MNRLHFDPNTSFIRLPIVWGTFSLITTLSIAVAAIIITYSDLHFDFSYRGFNNFIEVFKVPISIWAINIPVIAVFAANHRSVQTKQQLLVAQQQVENALKQISATENQNIFSNYYKHIEEFEKYCSHHLNEEHAPYATLLNVRSTHQMLFPDAIYGDLSINKTLLTSIERTFMRIHNCISDFMNDTHPELTESLLAIDQFINAEERRFGIKWVFGAAKREIDIGSNKLVFHYGQGGTLSDFFLFLRWRAELINLILNFDLKHREMPELDKLLYLDHRRINSVHIEKNMNVRFKNPYINKENTFENIVERLYVTF